MAPGARRSGAPQGPPPSRRGTGGERGGGRASLQSAPRLWRIRETLPGRPSLRASRSSACLGEPAPSVGFKRPLSALEISKRPAAREPGLSPVHAAAWSSFPQTVAFARPNVRSHLCPLPLISAHNASKGLQGRTPNWKASLRSPEHLHAYRNPFCSTLNNGLSASLCAPRVMGTS